MISRRGFLSATAAVAISKHQWAITQPSYPRHWYQISCLFSIPYSVEIRSSQFNRHFLNPALAEVDSRMMLLSPGYRMISPALPNGVEHAEILHSGLRLVVAPDLVSGNRYGRLDALVFGSIADGASIETTDRNYGVSMNIEIPDKIAAKRLA